MTNPIPLPCARIRPVRSRSMPASVRRIQSVVSASYEIDVVSIAGGSSEARFVFPRQIAMYLCRQLTPCSYPELGRCFGHRHHSTVIHAVRRVEYHLGFSPDLAQRLADLKRAVKANIELPCVAQARPMPAWAMEMRAAQERIERQQGEILELLGRATLSTKRAEQA